MAENMLSEDLLLIDWFSFSLKNIKIEEAASFIGLDQVIWIDTKGARGYTDRKYFSGISIHYNGRPDMGIWFEFSGIGCRAFEDFSSMEWFELFDSVTGRFDSHITRLDIAFDDHSCVFPLDRIMYDTENNNFISPSSWYEVVRSSSGSSCYIGSPRSDIRIRFYDKAAERKVDGHWIRCELQLRDVRALQFIILLLSYNKDEYYFFKSVLNKQIRFVSPTSDSNKSRWPDTDYWRSFISDSSKISLVTNLGSSYNMEDIYHNVFIRWGNAIDTVLKTMDLDEFIERLSSAKRSDNPKYKAALISFYEKYKKGFNNE